MESCLSRLQHVHSDSQLEHGILVHDVDATSIIDQYLGEFHIDIRAHESWIQDKSITSWCWNDLGVILYAPSYLLFKPMHVLWNCGIHFHRPSLLTLFCH